MARRFPATHLVVFALVLALGIDGCGDGETSSRRSGRGSATLSGSLTVFAAKSLTEAFGDENKVFRRSAPGVRVRYDFAGSQQLVEQIRQGAPADVFAAADEKTMGKLLEAGLVQAPVIFARNRLQIAVGPGNPKGIHRLEDLARRDVTLVLADPSVPAGSYSSQVLTRTQVSVNPRSLELDVKSALAKVTSGEADATIVYVSDVRAAAGKARGIVIPDDQNVIATYPIAVVKASEHRAAALAFIDQVRSRAGQATLARRGFLPAS